MKSSSMIATAALLCLAVALSAGHALAQEKQKVSYRVSEQNSKYTQQHVIDVGDVPGHQVRVFEIQRMLPADAPAINGIKLNGPSSSYDTYLFENGDRLFVVLNRTGST